MKGLRAKINFFIVALLSVACSRTSAQHQEAPDTNTAHETEILSVTMHRSACFGTCPVYTVTAKSDGSVSFDGERDVKVKGKSQGSIAKSDYDYLALSIKRLQFSTWNDQYHFEKDGCKSVWTDNPSVDIVVATQTGKKHVSYYYGCRGFALASKIDLLSKIIDDVTDASKWVGPEE
ncbi:DUF6438 domain-containing protein [Xanthomonas tesorieronis]|uniref:DUF6438 domain-containing protein n=1 Tax=Xanthomonas tesorieronis TaxID=3160839 RepID=UPI003512683F